MFNILGTPLYSDFLSRIHQYYFTHATQMESTEETQLHNQNVVFEFEYFINLNLKLKCGFSTTSKFTPVIWFHDKKKNFIGLYRDMWIHLMTYKDYIQIRLDQYEFFDSFNLLNDLPIGNLKFDFRQKDGRCLLILQQNGNKIKIDCETWRSITRIGIFLTTFVCWNNILQKQIAYFYNSFYIPTCARLKKTNIQVHDIKGFYEKDVEIDLTRLCFEFSKKMENQIKQDVKIYKLLLRIDNK